MFVALLTSFLSCIVALDFVHWRQDRGSKVLFRKLFLLQGKSNNPRLNEIVAMLLFFSLANFFIRKSKPKSIVKVKKAIGKLKAINTNANYRRTIFFCFI